MNCGPKTCVPDKTGGAGGANANVVPGGGGGATVVPGTKGPPC